MKFLIAGAGAIGGYIGAKLAQAGEDVTLFARGAHLAAMQARGLRVTSAEGDFTVQSERIDVSVVGRHGPRGERRVHDGRCRIRRRGGKADRTRRRALR